MSAVCPGNHALILTFLPCFNCFISCAVMTSLAMCIFPAVVEEVEKVSQATGLH